MPLPMKLPTPATPPATPPTSLPASPPSPQAAASARGSRPYWLLTGGFAFLFASGGAADLLRAELAMRGLLSLGYPAYFATILGAWKVLAAAALLWPRLPRLKEWAYAGIAFDLTGAALSHLAAGHGLGVAARPLLLLGVAIASWALRPPSRVLGALRAQPI